VAWAVLGLLAVTALVWWVTNSPIFDLRSLRVSGTSHLSAAQVEAAGGLGQGTNLLWFAPGRAERRLETDPWILSARIARSLPSSLQISIIERTPVAVVVAPTGHFLVASDGVILGPAPSAGHLPVVDAGLQRLKSGSRLQQVAMLHVVIALPAQLRTQVRSVGVTTGRSVEVHLRSGVRVVFGDDVSAAAKGQALLAVLTWAHAHQVTPAVIDVRAPASPALRPVGATWSGGTGSSVVVPLPARR
jgi:cell division protein FtsQ